MRDPKASDGAGLSEKPRIRLPAEDGFGDSALSTKCW